MLLEFGFLFRLLVRCLCLFLDFLSFTQFFILILIIEFIQLLIQSFEILVQISSLDLIHSVLLIFHLNFLSCFIFPLRTFLHNLSIIKNTYPKIRRLGIDSF